MYNAIKNLLTISKKYSKEFIKSSVLAVISVLFSFVPFFCVYKVIMLICSSGGENKSILLYGVISISTILIQYLFLWASTVISHKAAFKIMYETRVKLAEKLSRISLGFFSMKNSGKIKKVMIDDVEKLEVFLAHNIPEVTSNVASLLFLTMYLLFLDWRMTLAVIIVVPISLVSMTIMNKGNEEKISKFYNSLGTMNATIVEYIKGMHVIKVFNRSVSSFGKYRESVDEYSEHVLNWYKGCTPYLAIYFVVLASSIVFVLPLGGILFMRGSLTLSKLVLFLIVSFIYTTPLIKLFDFTESMHLTTEYDRGIQEILNLYEVEDYERKICMEDYTVRFKDVEFAYEKKNVLNGINLCAEQGKMTALVGPSGGGKSTVAKLIPRFWDVNKGAITIGNINIKDIPVKELMDKISFVFQDDFLFNISIKDNIRLGRPEATDDEIIEACKKAQCHEFIMKEKYKYNTIIGQKKGGFSGGERQRIAIARAILKDSPIIILDEATAFSDPENEDLIQQALLKLVNGKTVITIAHRLSSIIESERIYVIQDGYVDASGKHEELLENSSLYKNMWRAHTDASEWEFNLKGEVVS